MLLVVIFVSAFVTIYILNRPESTVNDVSTIYVDEISAMGHTISEFHWVYYSTNYNNSLYKISLDEVMAGLEEYAKDGLFLIVYYDREARVIWTEYGWYTEY